MSQYSLLFHSVNYLGYLFSAFLQVDINEHDRIFAPIYPGASAYLYFLLSYTSVLSIFSFFKSFSLIPFPPYSLHNVPQLKLLLLSLFHLPSSLEV